MPNAEKFGPIITTDTEKSNAEGVVSNKMERSRPTTRSAEGGFSNSSFLVPINESEASTKNDGLVMTMYTPEPDTESVVSIEVGRGRPATRVFKSDFLNFSLLVLMNESKPSIEKNGTMVTISTPKPDTKGVISTGPVEKEEFNIRIVKNKSSDFFNESNSSLK